MSKPTLIVFPEMLKTHVDQYVRKDGAVVQAHDDKRQAASPKQHFDAEKAKIEKKTGKPFSDFFAGHLAHDDEQARKTARALAATQKADSKGAPALHKNAAADHDRLATTFKSQGNLALSHFHAEKKRYHEAKAAGHGLGALDNLRYKAGIYNLTGKVSK